MRNRAAACEGCARADATADANCGPSRGEAAALLKPQIQNSKFKIQNWMKLPSLLGVVSRFRAQPAERSHDADLRDASCGPPRGEAAARCGSLPELQIQDSKLDGVAELAWGCIPIRVTACGELARCGPAGRELRASAALRLRPADPSGIDFA